MDKTGTLTQNKLSVHRITALNGTYSDEEIQTLIGTYAKLTSDKNATMRALEVYQPDHQAELVDEVPFSSEKKMSAIKVGSESKERVFVIGAYDLLINQTSDAVKTEAAELFANNGLGIFRNVLFGEVKDNTSVANDKIDLSNVTVEPICIISITDTVRDDVMDAIALFQKNGIRFKILSGDAAPAVQAVVQEIGWNVSDDELVTGTELDGVEERDFVDLVMRKSIFARLRPDHKLRIIKALRGRKIYTAMIGDGVNDLPAIKEADMGVAMEEGSSITKEVADIVLLKNKFSLLPNIFDEGNKIVNSVNAIAKLFLTKNFLIIYLSLLSLSFLLEFPLTPRRVSLVNVFAIGLPAFIISLKNANVSKSRKFLQDLFSYVTISAGVIVAAGHMSVYFANKYFSPLPENDLQMIMLTTMIITSIANFLTIALHRSEKNFKTYLLYGVLILILYLFVTITNIDFVLIDFIRLFYELSYLDVKYWLLVAVVGTISSAALFVLQQIRAKIVFPK
jgi:cation-transporting ATPase E